MLKESLLYSLEGQTACGPIICSRAAEPAARRPLLLGSMRSAHEGEWATPRAQRFRPWAPVATWFPSAKATDTAERRLPVLLLRMVSPKVQSVGKDTVLDSGDSASWPPLSSLSGTPACWLLSRPVGSKPALIQSFEPRRWTPWSIRAAVRPVGGFSLTSNRLARSALCRPAETEAQPFGRTDCYPGWVGGPASGHKSTHTDRLRSGGTCPPRPRGPCRSRPSAPLV